MWRQTLFLLSGPAALIPRAREAARSL